MKESKFRILIVVTGFAVVLCIGGYLATPLICGKRRDDQLAAVALALKTDSRFSGLCLATNQGVGHRLIGKVKTPTEIQLLRNLVSNLAPDVAFQLHIEWHDPRHGKDGVTSMTIGGGGMHENLRNGFSVACGISIVVLSYAIICAAFWWLWNKLCGEPKASRDWFVLICSPFLASVMVAIMYWKLPSKDSDWSGWLGLGTGFFILAAALFAYCLHLLAKSRYPLLSLLGLLSSGLVAVAGGSVLAGSIVRTLIRWSG